MAAWRNDTGRHGVRARATLTPPAIGATSADHSPRTRADDGRRERAFSDGEPLGARFLCSTRYSCAMANQRTFVGGPLDTSIVQVEDGRRIASPSWIGTNGGFYRLDEQTQRYQWRPVPGMGELIASIIGSDESE